MARFKGHGAPIYLPNPTWGNHIGVFKNSGLDVKKYRYYDPKTNGLDFEGELRGHFKCEGSTWPRLRVRQDDQNPAQRGKRWRYAA